MHRYILPYLVLFAFGCASPGEVTACRAESPGAPRGVIVELETRKDSAGHTTSTCAVIEDGETFRGAAMDPAPCEVSWDADEPSGGRWVFTTALETTATYRDSHSPLDGLTVSMTCQRRSEGH